MNSLLFVNPYDEEGIDADDIIIRRVPEHQVVWDDNGGLRRRRISKALYSKSSGLRSGMSIDIESLIIKDSKDPREYVVTPDFQGAVSFRAKEVRSLDLMVGYHPIKDNPGIPDNPYHGEVWRKDEAKKFTGVQQRGLVEFAEWYVEIPDVELK